MSILSLGYVQNLYNKSNLRVNWLTVQKILIESSVRSDTSQFAWLWSTKAVTQSSHADLRSSITSGACIPQGSSSSIFAAEFWITTEKSEDYVLKALKLEKLAGHDLKTNPMYKYYEKFLDKTLSPKVDNWLKAGKSDEYVKMELGLKHLTGSTLTASPKYTFYERYLSLQLDEWIKLEISNNYVLRELGLKGLTGEALTKNPKYERYETFVQRKLESWLGNPLYFSGVVRFGVECDTCEPTQAKDAYKTYVQYATMYDDMLFNSIKNGGDPFIVIEARARQNSKNSALG
ncbi:unnamed protein product [Phytophthora lilii]|uniref:Unnamed protein product n=1 Tax=Phytophthora lilii TaxID=2077276 RepID=A0A9W6XBY9_9STRA|nr:unnamed protein product [Phytophthora lilii]